MKHDDALICTQYQIKSEYDQMDISAVTFTRTNSPGYEGDRWAVRRTGSVLNRYGEWEYEPMPSNRDNEFYDRCRFHALEEAVSRYKEWAKNAPRYVPKAKSASKGEPERKT